MKITEKNETPSIELFDHSLVITITATGLKHAAENSPDGQYKILDANKFLALFAEQMINYQHSNAQETGVTFFQYVLYELVEQTVIDSDDDVVEIKD